MKGFARSQNGPRLAAADAQTVMPLNQEKGGGLPAHYINFQSWVHVSKGEPTSLSREDIRNALKQWNLAWDNHNLEGVNELFHEEVLFENWTGGRAKGKEDLKKAWEPWFTNHRGFRFTEEETFIDEKEQKVLYRWILEWPSLEKGYEGKAEKRRGVDVLHFQDGKIEQWIIKPSKVRVAAQEICEFYAAGGRGDALALWLYLKTQHPTKIDNGKTFAFAPKSMEKSQCIPGWKASKYHYQFKLLLKLNKVEQVRGRTSSNGKFLPCLYIFKAQ